MTKRVFNNPNGLCWFMVNSREMELWKRPRLSSSSSRWFHPLKSLNKWYGDGIGYLLRKTRKRAHVPTSLRHCWKLRTTVISWWFPHGSSSLRGPFARIVMRQVMTMTGTWRWPPRHELLAAIHRLYHRHCLTCDSSFILYSLYCYMVLAKIVIL